MLLVRALGLAIMCLLLSRSAFADETRPTPRVPDPVLSAAEWAVTQLVPSPLLVIGDKHIGAGMRWQLTPLLFSFGVAAKPVRTFFVSPAARHTGSVELHASPEWSCCAAHGGSSWLLRSGVRVYLPLIEHGEVLSWSVGGSYYRALGATDGGFAGDVGLYTLFGVVGLTVTVSPELQRRQVIVALNIRYF
jgi:hypothetical protein